MKKQLLVGAMLMGAFFTANAQDSCSDAMEIEVGTTTIGEIDGEYLGSDDGGCWNPPTTGTDADSAEWYVFTAESTGLIRINTDLAANDGVTKSNDTRISVYTGASCDELLCYSASDDVDNTVYLTNFTVPVIAGQTYYIAFDNKWSSLGFDVEVTVDSTPECATTAPMSEDWSNEANWYFCWLSEDLDQDGITWQYNAVNDLDGDGDNDPAAMIFPDIQAAPTGVSKNDWLISGALAMAAGSEYTVNVTYNAVDYNATYTADENLTIAMIPADEDMDIIELGTIEGIGMEGTLATLMQDALTEDFTFTPETAGDYSVGLLAESDGDTGILVIFEVEVTGTAGTNDVLASKFSIFPNPASNVIGFSNADNILVNGVVITDLNGRTVKTVNYAGVTEAQINVSDLATGMYMMTVSSDQGTMSKKIVKN